SDPKDAFELQPQFDALCRALKLNPYSPNILDTLRDPVKVPWTAITKAIESDVLGIEHGIFRACQSDDWVPAQWGLMDRQKSAKFARGLRERGVQNIVVGEVSDEWYIYSVSYPMSSPQDCRGHLTRQFPFRIVRNLMSCSCVLTHFPIRLLHRDLLEADFPVIRYRIEWTPEQLCPNGYVTHGTDKAIWSLLAPLMTPDQVDVSRRWLKAVRDETEALKAPPEPKLKRGSSAVLKLTKDRRIEWSEDEENYEGVMKTYEYSGAKRGAYVLNFPGSYSVTSQRP
ncbi:hypothetical protein F5887DRAFT_1021320, partial [Amanita rubescens]